MKVLGLKIPKKCPKRPSVANLDENRSKKFAR